MLAGDPLAIAPCLRLPKNMAKQGSAPADQGSPGDWVAPFWLATRDSELAKCNCVMASLGANVITNLGQGGQVSLSNPMLVDVAEHQIPICTNSKPLKAGDEIVLHREVKKKVPKKETRPRTWMEDATAKKAAKTGKGNGGGRGQNK